jgi:hypothetical protein
MRQIQPGDAYRKQTYFKPYIGGVFAEILLFNAELPKRRVAPQVANSPIKPESTPLLITQ